MWQFRPLRRVRTRLLDQRGQALVEFALVVPLVILLLLGIVDFGQAFNYQNDEASLAGIAMRYAEVNSCAQCGGQSIESYVRSTADSQALKNNGLTICFTTPSGVISPPPQLGDAITVKVSSTYQWLHYFHFSSLSSPIVATVTGRLETNYNPATARYTLQATC
jgi:Flp pilus assembly protein TadG